jgi:hypothetical protein
LAGVRADACHCERSEAISTELNEIASAHCMRLAMTGLSLKASGTA